MGWSGAEQIPFNPNVQHSHASVRLQGPSGALLRSWVHQAEFLELGEAPGVLVALALPVPQVGPKATLPGQRCQVLAEGGLDSESPDMVRSWPGCISAPSTHHSALRP